MAIVTDIGDNNNEIYRSVNGLGIPDEEKEKAKTIDKAVKGGLSALDKKISKMKLGKEKVIIYWEFGDFIRTIIDKYNIINAELSYFFMNIRFRAKPYELFLAEDRGKRSHILYCYRLGHYPFKEATAMKWSEWSYLLVPRPVSSAPETGNLFYAACLTSILFFSDNIYSNSSNAIRAFLLRC